MKKTYTGSCHCGAVAIYLKLHSAVYLRLSTYISIQLATLDNLDLQELIAASIRYADGRNDRWEVAPDETRHL